jgi:hypothetical protein
MNTEYIKNYREKELKQYVLAYLLIAIASVGFQSQIFTDNAVTFESLFKMFFTDIFVGAICVLVLVLNEIWPDKAKTKIIYKQMPSDTVFSDIVHNRLDSPGFDVEKAKVLYVHLDSASPNKQSAEWNLLLRSARVVEVGNVIEAERLQLMTRDVCMTNISLLIMNAIAIIVLAIVNCDFLLSLKLLGLPVIYLSVMYFVTKAAARTRAKRLVSLVVKNDVQMQTIKEREAQNK